MWNPKLYDDRHAFVWRHGADLIDLLAPRPAEAVLDLGCGTGHLTARIADAGTAVLGVDNSPEMVAEARRAYPALTFEVGDARHLAFDAVFSNAVLHWVTGPAKVEAESVVLELVNGRLVIGSQVKEFDLKPTDKGKVTVTITVTPPQAFKSLCDSWVDAASPPRSRP